AKQPGARLNIEVDAMTQAVVDTVQRVLAGHPALAALGAPA
ncbi:MAG TPA: riboflavin synthase, partial [Deltaproteobacteria bacterium]|nr:riboflavin synthase [Deltaproteobacteria bacterium]